MKRALPTLLALLAIAAPARRAGAVIIVDEYAPNAATAQNAGMQKLALQRTLGIRKSPYRIVPHTAVTTAAIRDGQLTTSQGVEQHRIVVHLNYDTDQAPFDAARYDPRTYLRSGGWPNVVHVWLFSPTGTSYNNTGTDTTGVNDFYPSGQALFGSLYAVGRPWTWKNLYAAVKPAVATFPRPAGYYRGVVAYGVTAASVGNVNSSGIRNFVVNPDSLLNRSDNPDSVLAWMRAKSGSAADLARGQVFMAFNGTPIPDLNTLDCVMAMAESLAAIVVPQGDAFPHREHTTRSYGLFGSSANRYGSPNAMNETRGGGIYCPSLVAGDTCDVPYFAQVPDSMNNLTDVDGVPIPFTWFVDTDSMNTPNGRTLMEILKRAKGASFGVQNVSGAVAGANTAWAASTPTTSRDPMGNVLARTLFPTVPSLVPQCATDTGAVQCRLKAAFDNLEAFVPGRVDHTLMAEEFDVTPTSWTAASAGAVVAGNLWGGEDSLRAAMWSVGVRAVLFCPTYAGHNAGMTWASTSGATGYDTNPSTYSPTERMWDVRWGGRVVGRIAHLGARWEPQQTQWRWLPEGHPGITHEWFAGAELGKYYLVDAGVYYHHTFSVSTRVFGVPAGSLGGPRGTPWPQRPGFWQLKWAVHGANAANSFMPRWPDGSRKLLIKFDRLEDLQP